MVAQSLVRDGGRPLWAQLLKDLGGRLARGEFNGAFPGEHALAREYRVSRATARRALSHLRAEGIVSAHRGRVSRVMPRAEAPSQLGLREMFATAERELQRTESSVMNLDVRPDEVVAARFGLEETEFFLYVERVHDVDGEPLAVEQIWRPIGVGGPSADRERVQLRCGRQSVVVANRHPAGCRGQVRAVVPTDGERAVLQMGGSSVAALEIARPRCRNGTPVEWRSTLIRGDRLDAITWLCGPIACLLPTDTFVDAREVAR